MKKQTATLPSIEVAKLRQVTGGNEQEGRFDGEVPPQLRRKLN